MILTTYPELRDLGGANLEKLQACRHKMSHEAYLRCRHIVTENTRVIAAADAMREGHARRMGELMVAAHASERDDFECSCEQIDFLVETAIELPGCAGARLTGGGFGGCTVTLVFRDQAEEFCNRLSAAYKKHFGVAADTYVCEAADGAYTRNHELFKPAIRERH